MLRHPVLLRECRFDLEGPIDLLKIFGTHSTKKPKNVPSEDNRKPEQAEKKAGDRWERASFTEMTQ